MDPGSTRSARWPPPAPPPVVRGCHGDAVPFGTSGWSLGPFHSGGKDGASQDRKNTEQNLMLQQPFLCFVLFLFFEQFSHREKQIKHLTAETLMLHSVLSAVHRNTQLFVEM